MKILRQVLQVQLITGLFFSSCYAQNFTDYSAYLPEIRQFNKVFATIPKLNLSSPEDLKAMRSAPTNTPKLTIEPQNRNINISSGNIRLRIFRPTIIKAIVIDIHGGGWCFGTPEGGDIANDLIAKTCNVAVISIDYRMCPENSIPAQINDCAEVIKWVLNNAKSEFGVEKIILQGNSAGAHLALTSVLRLKGNEKLDSRIVGFNLLYGVYDLSKTPSLRQSTDSTLLLSKHNINEIWSISVDKISSSELTNPTLSPLFANLNGLCPALFTIGTADPLIDDTNFMVSRWLTAGNKATLEIYPECPHGFDTAPTQIARIAHEKIYAWISERIK